ncbi:DUF4435 domain-containing protein [Acinetobacter sp. ANC 4648]|uniref:DUF4435 domain-containing protein n=1 Tax=Acinetobacter sp. ANC 4648 TaxID=1977875 RepID=UPI000A34175B|nr:DUF4435 domain-containing protein [Acinetobacter sp. ANC 4648]OTG83547.1 hypothetical protein B9T27_03245 [Acinetobacter sp. ANC 4648]
MSKHNASLPLNTDNDLIAEQGVQTLDKTPLIVLEGGNDTKFFRYMFREIQFSPKTEVKKGWEGVYNFVEKWNKKLDVGELKKKHNKVIGVIDRDYHDYSNKIFFPNNIIKTDYRDLEIVLFESDTALNRILINYGRDPTSYPVKSNNDIDLDLVRSIIYEKSMALSKIRYFKVVSQIENFGINCITDEGKGFENFFCHKTFNLDEKKLASLLCQRNRQVKEETILSWINTKVEIDPKLLCRGHDIISILARSFRKYFNNLGAQLTSSEDIEKELLLAFPFNEFKELTYVQELLNQLEIKPSI